MISSLNANAPIPSQPGYTKLCPISNFNACNFLKLSYQTLTFVELG